MKGLSFKNLAVSFESLGQIRFENGVYFEYLRVQDASYDFTAIGLLSVLYAACLPHILLTASCRIGVRSCRSFVGFARKGSSIHGANRSRSIEELRTMHLLPGNIAMPNKPKLIETTFPACQHFDTSKPQRSVSSQLRTAVISQSLDAICIETSLQGTWTCVPCDWKWYKILCIGLAQD